MLKVMLKITCMSTLAQPWDKKSRQAQFSMSNFSSFLANITRKMGDHVTFSKPRKLLLGVLGARHWCKRKLRRYDARSVRRRTEFYFVVKIEELLLSVTGE